MAPRKPVSFVSPQLHAARKLKRGADPHIVARELRELREPAEHAPPPSASPESWPSPGSPGVAEGYTEEEFWDLVVTAPFQDGSSFWPPSSPPASPPASPPGWETWDEIMGTDYEASVTPRPPQYTDPS
eukprot:6648645-Prymnesium_polylepis.2